MHVCKCVPRMYVYTVDIQLNLRLRRFRSLAFAAMDHDLGRRMFKALCGGKIRSQYGGWVKRRALAQFLQVREEAIAKIVDGTASIRNDEGKPYFETELDERRHVCIKANASLEEMALLGVLQPVSEVQDLEADTPPQAAHALRRDRPAALSHLRRAKGACRRTEAQPPGPEARSGRQPPSEQGLATPSPRCPREIQEACPLPRPLPGPH